MFHTLDLPLQPDLYVSLVKECTIQRDSASALRLHTHFTNSRSPSAVPVLLLDRLLLMHVSCGHFQIARQLFDEMPPLDRHAISWAILVTAYSHNAQYDETILFFLQMLRDDDNHHHQLLQFPRVAMVSVLKACMYTENKGLGKQLHGLLLKFSPTFADDLVPLWRILTMELVISHHSVILILHLGERRFMHCVESLREDGGRTARQVHAFAMKLQGEWVVCGGVQATLQDESSCSRGDLSLCELNFKTLVDGLGAVFYQYPFNVPAYYALILRSLTVLEGLALNADPNFKVLAASYPYFAKRLLTDPNPYLRYALIELLFKDGWFRWNRLENLLVQGSKDRDLKLLLGEDGEELGRLVVREAVYVSEAVVLTSVVDTYNSIPAALRLPILNGNGRGPLTMSETEFQRIREFRDRVFSAWGLLQTSADFDPALLQPVLQNVVDAGSLGGRVIGGVTQRLMDAHWRLPLAIMALPAILNSSNNFELLRKSESEVFDMIESAITVAALRWPEKLLAQKHRIFKPYDMACRSSSTKDDDDGGYNSTGYNQEITKEEEEPVYNQEITKEDEEEPTKPRRRIIRIKLVKDGKPTTATTVGSGTGATTATTVGSAATTVGSAATTVGRGMGANLKMASDVPWSNSEEYEKKLENSKRKLKEGYSKFEDSRKRSKMNVFSMTRLLYFRYEKLQGWDDALRAYTVQASQASSLLLVLEEILGMFFLISFTRSLQSLKDFITWKLGTLVSIVRQHIRKYLPELLSLISELWSSIGLLATNRPSHGYPVPTSVNNVNLYCYDAGTLDEHMHLLFPALIRLFKVVDIGCATIKTLTRLIPRVQEESPCCLAHALGEDSTIFIPSLLKLLLKHRLRHNAFDDIEGRLRRRETLIPGSTAQRLGRHSPVKVISDPLNGTDNDPYEDSTDVQRQLGAQQVNDGRLCTAGEASQHSTKEDWVEWMRHFSIELPPEGPFVGRELFAAGFVSCWAQLNEASQKQLVRSLEMTFSSPNIPPEILATLLNLAEFMEYDEKPLPIDIRLGALAEKCRAFAKALHYKEMVFEGAGTKKMDANLVAVVEDLIHINNQLHQHEAAVGILTYAQQHLGVQLKESWYEKLQRWDDALRAYNVKASHASSPHLVLEATLGLEEASRLFFGEHNIEGMLKAYRHELVEAWDCCMNYKRTLKEAEVTQSASPDLVKCRDLELAVPGTYQAGKLINFFVFMKRIASHEQKDHYGNLCAVVSGEKHFLLVPPTDVHRMYIRDLF
ncbi:Serine/threonine-protein kinase TOR [Linum grandiflorum]